MLVPYPEQNTCKQCTGTWSEGQPTSCVNRCLQGCASV